MERQNPVLLLDYWSPFIAFFCNCTEVQPCRLFHYPDFACKGGSEFDACEKVKVKWTKIKTLKECQSSIVLDYCLSLFNSSSNYLTLRISPTIPNHYLIELNLISEIGWVFTIYI